MSLVRARPLLPDFVLAGAPKCGTSSLYHWLVQHPEIVGSTPKEPFYFMDEDNPLIHPERNYHRRALMGYPELFASPARRPDALYFEATTHLIYQQTALEVLPELPTEPKFIFLLRDPLRRLRSSFDYTRENLARVRGSIDFEGYANMLLAGSTQPLAQYVRSRSSLYVLERDLDYCDYWKYLERWLHRVGPSRMLVLQLEALQRNPGQVMTDVCEFLGVSPEPFQGTFGFATKNETIAVSNRALHRWAKRWSRALPPGQTRALLRRAYYRLQQRTPHKSTISPKLEAELRRRLERGHSQLASHFGLQLGLWGAS